jgi:hypothetical protein
VACRVRTRPRAVCARSAPDGGPHGHDLRLSRHTPQHPLDPYHDTEALMTITPDRKPCTPASPHVDRPLLQAAA